MIKEVKAAKDIIQGFSQVSWPDEDELGSGNLFVKTIEEGKTVKKQIATETDLSKVLFGNQYLKTEEEHTNMLLKEHPNEVQDALDELMEWTYPPTPKKPV